jgi:DNA gyrase/topoisomerase IV subunit A
MDDGMTKTIERTTKEIIDSDYKEFALYTLESRAIPSAIDGFKPVIRKLVYALNDKGGTKTKVAELGGMLSSYGYDHGESSAMGAAVTIAAPYNNNEPIFTGHGSFGTRLVQEAASPRYIYVSMGPAFKKYFIDTQVAPVNENTDHPEPRHFLPTIPWVLVNGISGIAVGFKTDILPRSIADLRKATLACIKNPEKFLAENAPILPTFPHFRGKVTSSEGKYFSTGIVDYVGKYTYNISELPVGYDRAKYIEHHEDMIEKDKIRDYTDECSKSGFGFTVKVSVAQKSDADRDPLKYFSLVKSHSENLTTIGYDNKIKIFGSVAELIHYFVGYRTIKFGEKLAYDIAEEKENLQFLENKLQFIQSVVSGKFTFKGSSRTVLEQHIVSLSGTDKYVSKLISIPTYGFTTDAVDELESKIAEVKAKISQLEVTTPVVVFLSVLK